MTILLFLKQWKDICWSIVAEICWYIYARELTALGIALGTVKTHVGRAVAKVGVRGKEELGGGGEGKAKNRVKMQFIQT